jgi:hypothetical protein
MGLWMLNFGTIKLMKSHAWVGVYATPDSTHSSTLQMKEQQANRKSAGAKIGQPIEYSISSCFVQVTIQILHQLRHFL